MEDVGDWGDFPCFRIAFYHGFYRVSCLGVTVEGPVSRRDPEPAGTDYTPNCIPFDGTGDPELGLAYTRESKRWKDLNDKPGLLEETPWSRERIKAFLRNGSGEPPPPRSSP